MISDRGFRHQDEKTVLIAHVSIDFATTTERKVPSSDPSPQHGGEEIRSPAAPKSQPESVDHELRISQFDRVHHKALNRTHQSAHYEWASIQQLVAVC